jgi:hypothetical protein
MKKIMMWLNLWRTLRIGTTPRNEQKKKRETMKNIDYYQVIEMTKEEKIAMYMKLTKKELIEMLLQNQELLEQRINSDIPPRWYTNMLFAGTTINSSGVGTKKIKL